MVNFTDTRLVINSGCRLFCCPPTPAAITSKLAFEAPIHPHYRFSYEENAEGNLYTCIEIRHDVWEVIKTHDESDHLKLDIFYWQTKTCYATSPRLACSYLESSGKNNQYTILYSGPNAADMGSMIHVYFDLRKTMKCNVFGYDYSGYGMTGGRASEKNLYRSVKTAYKCLRRKYNISPENIILYGQSIGTAASTFLASKRKVGGLILHSPLMSGLRVLFGPDKIKRTLFFDPFPIIKMIKKVKCPTLVIHGTDDQVVSFPQGLAIYQKCPNRVDPLWIDGADHSNLHEYEEYSKRLVKFIEEDMPKQDETVGTKPGQTLSSSC